MPTPPLPLLQGTLDLLVLKTLVPGAMHGYGIATAVRERTGGELNIEDAALYQSLHRLDRQGLIEAEWRPSENNRRARYYTLTAEGRKRFTRARRRGGGTRARSRPCFRGADGRAKERSRPFWYLRRRPEAVAAEVDDELREHLEMKVEELTAGGMPVEEARREALRQFGDLEETRRYCRSEDERGERRVQRTLWLQDFGQDVRVAVRSLLRAPVLALAIVMTVGLGIGATTAIFCAVNAALLRPLPYAEPERLVRIYTGHAPVCVPVCRRRTTSPWRRSRRTSRRSPPTRAAR